MTDDDWRLIGARMNYMVIRTGGHIDAERGNQILTDARDYYYTAADLAGHW